MLFGSNDCDECKELKQYWQEEYTQEDDPTLVFISIDYEANYQFLEQVEEALGIDDKATAFPVIFAGRKTVVGGVVLTKSRRCCLICWRRCRALTCFKALNK